MKLRKLLAGITAAALAVSAMAFSSLSVSAAEEADVVTVASNVKVEGTFVANGEWGSACNVTFEGYSYNTPLKCDDYTKIEMDVKISSLGNAESISLFINTGDNDKENPTKWVATAGTAKDGTLTLDLTKDELKGKIFSAIGYQLSTSTNDVTDAFNGDITINSVKLYKKAAQEPEKTPEEEEVEPIKGTYVFYVVNDNKDPNGEELKDGDKMLWKWVASDPKEIEIGGEAVSAEWSAIGETEDIKKDNYHEICNEGIQLSSDDTTLIGKTITIEVADLEVGGEKRTVTNPLTAVAAEGEKDDGTKIAQCAFSIKLQTADLGKSLKCSIKASVKAATENPSTGGETTDNGGSSGDNTTASAPTVSSNKHQGVGMPPVVIDQKSAPAASAGETAAASGSTSVTLGDSTVVSKDVIDSVSGKDAEFKLANGASWEIAAADAAKAEGMDLGITLNTTAATADQIKEVAKDNDTFQFSLAYSGDFGFSAVVNIPVDAKYNGKYANLYWLNGGKLEFIGSSKVEGGIADFTMKHASDYVIVFDDEAYGEDVSSGAGIYEESETSAAPVAVVVTFAALAVSAVILKKRVF